MSRDRLTSSVVKILSGREVIGTGFVVTPDLIATCAHVVLQAGSGPGHDVRIRCSADDAADTIDALVVPQHWRDPAGEDIAFLQIERPLPRGVEPAVLGESTGLEGHTLHGYGFPEGEGRGGLWAKAVVVGRLHDRRLQLRSQEISPGYSGGPLLDEEHGVIGGMITAIRPVDPETGRHTETAFAVTTEALKLVCPELRLKRVSRQLKRRWLTPGQMVAGATVLAALAGGAVLVQVRRHVDSELIVVNDGGEPVRDARVQLSSGASQWTESTGASGVARFEGLARSLLDQRVSVCVTPPSGKRWGASFLLKQRRTISLCDRSTHYVAPEVPLVLRVASGDPGTTFVVERGRAPLAEQRKGEYLLGSVREGVNPPKISVIVTGAQGGFSLELLQAGLSVGSYNSDGRTGSSFVYRVPLHVGGPCLPSARAEDVVPVDCP